MAHGRKAKSDIESILLRSENEWHKIVATKIVQGKIRVGTSRQKFKLPDCRNRWLGRSACDQSSRRIAVCPKSTEREVRRDAAERDPRRLCRACSDAARNCAGNRARCRSSVYSAATGRSGGDREIRLSPGGRSGPHFSVAEKANGCRFQRLQGKHADPADPTTNDAAPDRKDQSVCAVPARQQKRDRSAF